MASAAAGTGLGNYAISYVNGALTVNPAALTVTANNQAKTYGQTFTFAGTEFTAAGLVNGDTVTGATITSGGAAATATVAGSPYSIVPSAATGTGLSSNYTITYADGLLTVNPASLTVTANNLSKTYGQSLTFAGTEFTTSGLVNADTVSSVTLTSSQARRGHGDCRRRPYSIVPSAATVLGGPCSNYTITYANGSFTVNPAALTVTANNESKTYGQTAFAGTAFTTSGTLSTAIPSPA